MPDGRTEAHLVATTTALDVQLSQNQKCKKPPPGKSELPTSLFLKGQKMDAVPVVHGRLRLRVTGLVVAGVALVVPTACSSNSSTASSTSPPATTSVTPSAITTTDFSTSVVTVTATTVTTGPPSATAILTGVIDDTTTSVLTGVTESSRPSLVPCPGSGELSKLLPAADRNAGVAAIQCSGEWAVGNYSQAGKNQVTGVFHYGTADGHWSVADRNQVCAMSINLPPALYQRACSSN